MSSETAQENRSRWIGVQPTNPESNPIPVKLQDSGGAAQGVLGNPVVVSPVGNTVYIGGPNPLPTEDTGTNTNPRMYEIQNAFRSQVLPLTDDNPQVLISLTTTPARTAGESLYIYKLALTNRSGQVCAVSLEQPAGTEIHNQVFVDPNDSVNEDFPTPIPAGATGVWVRRHSVVGTTSAVYAQVIGLEV